MNTYKPQESLHRTKFNDASVLAILLALCMFQVGACYESATESVRHPETAAQVLTVSTGTEFAHTSADSMKTNSVIVSPLRDSRG